MRKYIPKFGFWYVVKLCILFVIYFVTARFGLSIFAVHTFATIIWAPTGIALGFLILYGYDLWPAILIGAFAVNLYTGAGVFVALGIAIGNTLEAVIGTYLLRKYIQLYRCFERLPDTILFIAIVSLIAAVISATVGTSCLLLGHLITFADIPSTWIAWWVGDTLGALIITPFMLVCIRPSRPWNKDNLGWFEMLCGSAFLIISNLLIFWYAIGQLQNSPLLYLILFPLIWAGLRFGSRGMTIAILVTSIFAVFSTIYGHGPFVTTPPGAGLLFLQIFIGTLAVTFLIFLSIVKERRASMEKLRVHVDELEHAVKAISSADRAKNDFLAILAHELRNPLAPVLSSLELMKTRIAEYSEMAPLVKTMETHVHTMSHLLDDILDISRISRKKFKLEKEVFALQTIIARSVETVAIKIKSKDHSLLIKVPPETIWLFGDPLRMEQILVNLLINATKYTHTKGRIVLSVIVEEDVAIISVKDNGVGITAAVIDKIFEPFMQAINREDMRSDAGLGIGLALTKKLVELHNGNIVAKSEGQGLGSEFIVTLPIPQNIQIPLGITETTEHQELNPASALAQINAEESGRKVAEKKYKILVVDDNVEAADSMRLLLAHNGHDVESVYDGVVALQRIRGSLPEIIVLDIGLPLMDGYEVAKKIREDLEPTMPHKIILIALTGYGQESDKIKAMEAGFNHHLTKPISVSDIEKILMGL